MAKASLGAALLAAAINCLITSTSFAGDGSTLPPMYEDEGGGPVNPGNGPNAGWVGPNASNIDFNDPFNNPLICQTNCNVSAAFPIQVPPDFFPAGPTVTTWQDYDLTSGYRLYTEYVNPDTYHTWYSTNWTTWVPSSGTSECWRATSDGTTVLTTCRIVP